MVNFTPWRKNAQAEAGATERPEKEAGASRKWNLGILSAETDEVPGRRPRITSLQDSPY